MGFCIDHARLDVAKEWDCLKDFVAPKKGVSCPNGNPYYAMMAVTFSCTRIGLALGLILGGGEIKDKEALKYLAGIAREFKEMLTLKKQIRYPKSFIGSTLKRA